MTILTCDWSVTHDCIHRCDLLSLWHAFSYSAVTCLDPFRLLSCEALDLACNSTALRNEPEWDGANEMILAKWHVNKKLNHFTLLSIHSLRQFVAMYNGISCTILTQHYLPEVFLICKNYFGLLYFLHYHQRLAITHFQIKPDLRCMSTGNWVFGLINEATT